MKGHHIIVSPPHVSDYICMSKFDWKCTETTECGQSKGRCALHIFMGWLRVFRLRIDPKKCRKITDNTE